MLIAMGLFCGGLYNRPHHRMTLTLEPPPIANTIPVKYTIGLFVGTFHGYISDLCWTFISDQISWKLKDYFDLTVTNNQTSLRKKDFVKWTVHSVHPKWRRLGIRQAPWEQGSWKGSTHLNIIPTTGSERSLASESKTFVKKMKQEPGAICPPLSWNKVLIV